MRIAWYARDRLRVLRCTLATHSGDLLVHTASPRGHNDVPSLPQ